MIKHDQLFTAQIQALMAEFWETRALLDEDIEMARNALYANYLNTIKASQKNG